jgi:hypothetical protein
VIAFYLENKTEVDEYVARERAEIERFMATIPPNPELLRIRRIMQERGLLEPQ